MGFTYYAIAFGFGVLSKLEGSRMGESERRRGEERRKQWGLIRVARNILSTTWFALIAWLRAAR